MSTNVELHAPSMLPRRALRRIALAAIRSLIVVVALTTVAAACEQALPTRKDTGHAPSSPPSKLVPTPEPDTVTITLSDEGCWIDAADRPIDPAHLRFVAKNDTRDWAGFDIGRIDREHSFRNLVEHVDLLGSAPVDDLAGIRPDYFEGTIDEGLVHDDEGIVPNLDFDGGEPDLMIVRHTPLRWLPRGEAAQVGIYSVICYRVTDRGTVLTPIQVVGPVQVGSPFEVRGTRFQGRLVGSITVDDGGCHFARLSDNPVELDYLRISFRSETSAHASVEVGRVSRGATFRELRAFVASAYSSSHAARVKIPSTLFSHATETTAGLSFPHGGMGPHIGNPFELGSHWSAVWNGPHSGVFSTPQTFVAICYVEEARGGGVAIANVVGPFKVR